MGFYSLYFQQSNIDIKQQSVPSRDCFSSRHRNMNTEILTLADVKLLGVRMLSEICMVITEHDHGSPYKAKYNFAVIDDKLFACPNHGITIIEWGHAVITAAEELPLGVVKK